VLEGEEVELRDRAVQDAGGDQGRQGRKRMVGDPGARVECLESI
jgi:hypothetical protein